MFNVKRFNAAIALKGETQKDAAEVMKMSAVTLYRKINGFSDFYRNEIDLFCKHYDANANDIFFANDVS